MKIIELSWRCDMCEYTDDMERTKTPITCKCCDRNKRDEYEAE